MELQNGKLRIKMENKKLEFHILDLHRICLLRQALLVGLFLGYSVAAFFLNMYETWPSHLRPVFFGDKDERPARKKREVFGSCMRNRISTQILYGCNELLDMCVSHGVQ